MQSLEDRSLRCGTNQLDYAHRSVREKQTHLLLSTMLTIGQWRPREFKVGETKRNAEEDGVWGGMFPSPPGTVWEGANFLFCDLEMAYFGEFWGC